MVKTFEKILNFIEKSWELQYSVIKANFSNINETTLVRNLNKLLEDNKIKKRIEWKKTFYSISWKEYIYNYFQKPFFEREKRIYNFDFLWNYIPNKTSFLWERYEDIKRRYLAIDKLSTYNYQSNIRWIENLLIDLTFSSSKLEWNTYSYLDTEVLVKYNEEADGKTKEETQMVINHKNVIKYIIEERNKILLNIKTFSEVHMILWKWLLLVEHLWKIRSTEVKIWTSVYQPLDNALLLRQEFNLFLEKLNQIQNPFEQSLFILVFIPYFQLFMDINKRTSRISANIPLIKNWLAPISLLQTKERDYIDAILAVYELNDISLIRNLFVDNYLLNIDRYI